MDIEAFKSARQQAAWESCAEARAIQDQLMSRTRALLVEHAGEELVAALNIVNDFDGRIFVDVPKHIPIFLEIVPKTRRLEFSLLRGKRLWKFEHFGDALLAAEPMKVPVGEIMNPPSPDVESLLRRFHIPKPCPSASPTSSSTNNTSST